jgi:hypothetical protein
MSDETKDSQDEGERNGRYANFFKIGHNAFEFLFDFGQMYAESKPVPLHTRIVTTPVYAKSLLGLLQESIEQYEKLFGPITSGDK